MSGLVGCVAPKCALVVFAGSAALAGAPLGAGAQGPAAGTGLVAGVVRDAAGNEIVAAEVSLQGTRVRARTDAHGAFQIREVPAGQATLHVRRLGFKAVLRPTTVAMGIGEPVEVVVEPIAQRLPAVVVRTNRREFSGRLADFHRRRTADAGGYFLTRAQIDSQRPYRTTDLLRRVPGVNLMPADFGRREVRMRGMRCPPLVWMDGMALTTGYFDPDNVDPRTIEGMEIYGGLASVPPVLMGPRSLGSCGVIAIWSRVPTRRENRGEQVSPDELAALVDSLHIYTADQVDVAAGPDVAQPFAPPYPEQLWQSGTPGLVIAEFVVDTAGRVEPNTVGVVSSTHRPFAEAVEGALPDAVFTPAVRGGRRVRQLVQLPVHFSGSDAGPAGAAGATPPPGGRSPSTPPRP